MAVEVTTNRGPVVLDGMTCSIGAATYPGSGQDITELGLAADTAMYAAKEAGRNRVVADAASGGPEASSLS